MKTVSELPAPTWPDPALDLREALINPVERACPGADPAPVVEVRQEIAQQANLVAEPRQEADEWTDEETRRQVHSDLVDMADSIGKVAVGAGLMGVDPWEATKCR